MDIEHYFSEAAQVKIDFIKIIRLTSRRLLILLFTRSKTDEKSSSQGTDEVLPMHSTGLPSLSGGTRPRGWHSLESLSRPTPQYSRQ